MKVASTLLLGVALSVVASAAVAQTTSSAPPATAPVEGAPAQQASQVPLNAAQPTQPAGATPGAAGAPSGETSALGDIVVTAQKRATNVQRTPIAMDVVGGQQLQNQGITTLQGLSNAAPDVNFSAASLNTTTITIRGVSSEDVTELGDPAVTFSYDGEYVDRPVSINGSLYDISRVEVLRGPQGTLYGRNSTAGAINVITNAPSLSAVGGDASLEFGNFGDLIAQAAVNIPVSDTFAIRVAGIDAQHNGYRDHGLNGKSDDEDLHAGRVRALWKPTSRLSVLLTGEYIKTGGVGDVAEGFLIAPTASNLGTIPSFFDPDLSKADRKSWDIDFKGFLHTEQKDARGQIDYDLDWAQFTYLASYRHTSTDQFIDQAGTATQVLDFRNTNHYNTFQNEARLASTGSGFLTWQLGGFYFREKQEVTAGFYTPATVFSGYHDVYTVDFDYPSIVSTSAAAFGEATAHFTDKLSLTGGVRYTHDHKTRVGTQNTIDFGSYFGTGGAVVAYDPEDVGGNVKFNRVNYHVGLDYQLTPDDLLYAKVSSGYKAGGFTTTNTYKPETLTAYEIGTKNRFLDRKLQLNADAFYYDYTDQQVSVYVPVSAGLTALTTQNAGASHIWGVETSAEYAITPADRLSLTADYLHARYTKFDGAVAVIVSSPTDPGNVQENLAGNSPPQSPRWTFAGTYAHTWTFDWGKVEASVQSRYLTSYYLTPYNLPADKQGSYHQTDLYLQYTLPSGRFDVTAFVRNLEDNNIKTYSSFTSQGGANVYEFAYSAPRAYGVRAAVHF